MDIREKSTQVCNLLYTANSSVWDIQLWKNSSQPAIVTAEDSGMVNAIDPRQPSQIVKLAVTL